MSAASRQRVRRALARLGLTSAQAESVRQLLLDDRRQWEAARQRLAECRRDLGSALAAPAPDSLAVEALPYFEQACRQNPRDEITRCKLAALYLELGMKDEAYQAYLRAAESYAVRGERENTLSIYNILIMLQPGAVKARKQLSVLFSRMGRPDAAVEQLKWVIDFYYQHEEIPQAIETSRQLLETDPENAVAHVILGRLLTKSGDPLEAAEAFVQGARLFVKARRKDDALEAIAEGMGRRFVAILLLRACSSGG